MDVRECDGRGEKRKIQREGKGAELKEEFYEREMLRHKMDRWNGKTVAGMSTV